MFENEGFELGKILPSEYIEAVALEIPQIITSEVDSIVPKDQMANSYPNGYKLLEYANVYAKELLRTEKISITNIQLTIREPNSEDVMIHVDGRRSATSWSDMPQFDVVIGIPLVNLNEGNPGRLFLFPKAHHAVRKYIWQEWDALVGLEKDKAFRKMFDHVRAELQGKPSVEIRAEKGQIYALNALMPHGVTSNQSASPRPVWYFRFRKDDTPKGRDGFL